MSDNIDPRLAPYTALKKDPTDPKSCPTTQLADISEMVTRPVPAGQPIDMNAPNVTIKALAGPHILGNENLIDYKKDNQTPEMAGRSSGAEWASYLAALTHYAKNHPEFPLKIGPTGTAPSLPPEIEAQVIKEGSVIYNNYQDQLRMEQLTTNPKVVVGKPKGRSPD